MLVFWLLLIIVLLFCLGMVFGAPYLPTLNKQIKAALDLADIKEGQTLIELGCGDGRVLIAAAKRDVKSVGYELNPLLAIIALIRTWKYRKNTKIIWGNYWAHPWPEADVVFVFLINRYMEKLDTRLNKYPYKPIKLVSFAFKIPGKKYLEKKDGVYLYEYK